MSRRQRAPRETSDVHPTYAKILAQAMTELTEHGFDRFSVQRVLEAADVSRGTLYHHFGDVETLIEAALVETFAQENLVQRQLVVDLIERATDAEAFREGLREQLRRFSATPSVVRFRRTHAIALSATRPSLATAIASVQNATTDAWTEAVREAQRRGFVRADIDARSVAVMVQAIGLGRIVDDAADHQIGDDRWADIQFDVIDRGFLSR